MKNILRKTAVLTMAMTALSFSGCLNYERPPLAVDSTSYTTLQENEKKLLPISSAGAFFHINAIFSYPTIPERSIPCTKNFWQKR